MTGLEPRAFFAGCLAAFLGCSVLGNVLARRDHFQDFVRFHQLLTPEAFYRPTALQVYGLVKARVRRDRTNVVIGGSSVLNGAGQRRGWTWSEELQRRLGPGYVVVNLALRGGRPNELGMYMAETLIKERFPVLYVADVHRCVSRHRALLTQPLLFWDAWYRGFLLPFPEREAQLAGANERAAERRELRIGMWLNSWVGLAFTDFWSTTGYTHVFTIWSPLTAQAFWRPRRALADNEVLLDPDARYARLDFEGALSIVRHRCTAAQREEMARQERAVIPEDVRRRMILVLMRESPYYLARLSPEERDAYERDYAANAEMLQAETPGPDPGWTARDYVDRIHLSESGGRKLAAALAPVVRARAGALAAGR